MLNSLASGRRLARHVIALQLIGAVLIGAVFLVQGWREAVAASCAACLVAAGNALLSLRSFGRLAGAGTLLGRLLTGVILKWMVVIGGLAVILLHYKLPPLAAMTGLVVAYAIHLLAYRFKG